IGPGGGTRTGGSGSGSHTTQRGTTIEYGGAGAKGTTGGGVNYGKGVGGVQVTTPGGREVSKVGTAGGAVGPGGKAAGSKSGAVVGSGPGGSFGSAYHGGVAVGPQGAAAAGGRVGTATGPGGNTVAGGGRAAAATGPYGAAAVGAGAARTATGTYYRSAAAVSGQGSTVRQNFRNFAQENPLLAARWIGPTWRPVTWAALAGFAGYAAEPPYYDYGESVVYQTDAVYVNGESVGTPEQYTQQATELANVGVESKADPKAGEWQTLGVFAMVGEGEEKSTNLFQLALNKDGVIRGEYYNALTDTTEPVYGSVDKKTQRAAWSVAERKFPVYETGIANLTRDETTMLVHFSKAKSQQYALVRLQQPDAKAP
ncbi:MAG TPA: hypothetical protein VN641_10530, partial [Urbifossiella sp.]|nr:hypothetical protein [Urbifossiella sp.]